VRRRETLGDQPDVLPHWLVARTGINTSTTCCFRLALPTPPTNLYTGVFSPPLAVTAPATGLSFRVRLVSQGFFPSLNRTGCTPLAIARLARAPGGLNTSANLTVRPASFLFTPTGGEGRFTVRGPRAGCFILNYTVSGDDGTISPPRAQAFYILPRGAASPPPALLSARFTAAGATVALTLAEDTDRGGGTGQGQFRCAAVVSFTGASSAWCVWSTARLLLADLGPSAALSPGDTVTLLPGKPHEASTHYRWRVCRRGQSACV
jgi:hypothetical protein